MRFILLILFSLSIYSKEIVHKSFLQYMPPTMDPVLATETNSQFIINNSFDGLVAWDFEKGLIPQLATKWEFNTDKTKIKFTLRKATFSDGKELKSKDVQSHFERLKKSNYFRSHFEIIKNIMVLSNTEIEFTLKSYTPHFLHLLSGSHSKIVKKENSHIIGIGPFIPDFKQDKVILKKNSLYWGDKVNVDRIELSVIDAEVAKKKIQSKELDDMILNPGTINDFQNIKKDINWNKVPMWATWGIALDHKKISNTADRIEIVNSLPSSEFIKFYPGNTEAFGIQAIGMPGYLDKNPLNAIEKAERQSGKSKNIKIYIPKEVPSIELIENWIRSKKLNCCKLIPTKMDFVKIIETVGKGKLQSFLISFNPEYPDPGFLLRALYSSSGSNYLGISSQSIDSMIDKMNYEDDSLKKSELSYKINLEVMKEGGFVPLMHVVHYALSRNCVSGIQFNPISEGYFSLRNVSNKCQ